MDTMSVNVQFRVYIDGIDSRKVGFSSEVSDPIWIYNRAPETNNDPAWNDGSESRKTALNESLNIGISTTPNQPMFAGKFRSSTVVKQPDRSIHTDLVGEIRRCCEKRMRKWAHTILMEEQTRYLNTSDIFRIILFSEVSVY